MLHLTNSDVIVNLFFFFPPNEDLSAVVVLCSSVYFENVLLFLTFIIELITLRALFLGGGRFRFIDEIYTLPLVNKSLRTILLELCKVNSFKCLFMICGGQK